MGRPTGAAPSEFRRFDVRVTMSARDLMFAAEISWVEMRIAARYSILQRCFITAADVSCSENWPCIAYNISETGIGVVLPKQAPAGTKLTIRPWNLPDACSLQAVVVHTRPVKDSWFAGCELSKRLSADEVQIWCSGPADWMELAPAATQSECPPR